MEILILATLFEKHSEKGKFERFFQQEEMVWGEENGRSRDGLRGAFLNCLISSCYLISRTLLKKTSK